jgi:FtsP/CotA-like multicopper oxidase with cupredoxin domain
MGTEQPLRAPFSQNNLINGRNNYSCSRVLDNTPCTSDVEQSKFVFESGKSHLLRIVNGGSAGLQLFSIDEHEMTVVSNDFVPIEPYNTTVLTLGVSTRLLIA